MPARRAGRPVSFERWHCSPDLQALEQSGSGPSADAGTGDALWWWQFHQLAIAVFNGVMPAAVWAVRAAGSASPYGSALFLATLMLATISVTLRLNLWFTSRVHPGTLVEHRARLFPAVIVADTLLAVALLGGRGASPAITMKSQRCC